MASDGPPTSLPASDAQLEKVSTILGYSFVDKTLLTTALTHRSGPHPSGPDQNPGQRINEVLEFLGDCVLGLVVTSQLIKRFPQFDQGKLNTLRQDLVKNDTLANAGRDLGLDAFLVIGPVGHRPAEKNFPKALADGMEALFGAVYLDGGFEIARKVVARLFSPVIDGMLSAQLQQCPKNQLSEWLQARALPLPAYRTIGREGPDHLPTFRVEASTSSPPSSAIGSGHSIMEAEKDAARKLLASLPLLQAQTTLPPVHAHLDLALTRH
jgi:ribonuclease III